MGGIKRGRVSNDGVNVTDEELMVRYQNGNYLAFEELYGRHSGRVYGYLKKNVFQAAEVDDLLQQVFLKLHNSRYRYDPRFPFLPWLFAIARNLRIDFMRQRKMVSVDIDSLSLASEADGASPIRSDADWLEQSLKGLGTAERELITLRFQEGLSFDEISRRTGASALTLRKRVSRMVVKLRGLMGVGPGSRDEKGGGDEGA